MCVYIYIYICIYIDLYIYIYRIKSTHMCKEAMTAMLSGLDTLVATR